MTITEKILKPKLGVLELAKQLGNVTEACRIIGYSRDTFYRYKSLYESGGEAALVELSRKKPNRKNRLPEEIEQACVDLAVEEPAWGQTRVANDLAEKGLFVSPAGVRCVWMRNGLQTMKKRLKALEKKIAEEGGVLTESQLQALNARSWRRRPMASSRVGSPGIAEHRTPSL